MADPAEESPVFAINTVLLKGDERDDRAAQFVLEKLRGLDPPALLEASNSVWIASREVQWREPLGAAGVLAFFQELLPDATDTTLVLNALRILGNACADKDANRQLVIDHPLSLSSVLSRLSAAETSTIACVVLYNICNGYEPAQLSAISQDAVPQLLAVINDENADYPCRILEALLAQKTGKQSAPESALKTVLELATAEGTSFDNTLTRLEVLNALLVSERFQRLAIAENHVPAIFDLIEHTYGVVPDDDSARKDRSLIQHARGKLVDRISDISGHEAFFESYSLDSPVMTRAQEWLNTPMRKRTDLKLIGCLVFGNVARDDVCPLLVKRGIHKSMFAIINDLVARYNETRAEAKENNKIEPNEDEEGRITGAVAVGVAHTATGALKNFSIPVENRAPLGNDGGMDVVRTMLEVEGIGAGQLYFSAVSLGRLLTSNCEENAKRMLEGDPTLLALSIERYAKVDEPPTKTEISRTIASILRTVHSSKPANTVLLDKLLQHNLARPLWDMILQDKWQSIVQEGWFAMALLAGSATGAGILAGEWGDEEDKRVETLVDDNSAEHARERDNCKVFLAEMMQNGAGEKAGRVLDLLRRILAVSDDAAQKPREESKAADESLNDSEKPPDANNNEDAEDDTKEDTEEDTESEDEETEEKGDADNGKKPPAAITITGTVKGTISGYAKGSVTKTTTGDTSKLIRVNVKKNLDGKFENTVIKKTIRRS